MQHCGTGDGSQRVAIEARHSVGLSEGRKEESEQLTGNSILTVVELDVHTSRFGSCRCVDCEAILRRCKSICVQDI